MSPLEARGVPVSSFPPRPAALAHPGRLSLSASTPSPKSPFSSPANFLPRPENSHPEAPDLSTVGQLPTPHAPSPCADPPTPGSVPPVLPLSPFPCEEAHSLSRTQSAYHAGAERVVLQAPHLGGDTTQRCARSPAGPTPVQPRPSGLRFKTQPERLTLPMKVCPTPKVEGRPLTLRWGHYHFMRQSPLHALPQPSDPGLRHSGVTRSPRARPPSVPCSVDQQPAACRPGQLYTCSTAASRRSGAAAWGPWSHRHVCPCPSSPVAPHLPPPGSPQLAPLLSALRCRAPEGFCCSHPAPPRPVARGPPGPEAKQPR